VSPRVVVALVPGGVTVPSLGRVGSSSGTQVVCRWRQHTAHAANPKSQRTLPKREYAGPHSWVCCSECRFSIPSEELAVLLPASAAHVGNITRLARLLTQSAPTNVWLRSHKPHCLVPSHHAMICVLARTCFSRAKTRLVLMSRRKRRRVKGMQSSPAGAPGTDRVVTQVALRGARHTADIPGH
jgi:hypothetical protein